MRIIDTPEMAKLWEEIKPYFSYTRDFRKIDKGDIFINGTPEEIKQKYKKYMDWYNNEEEKYIKDMCNSAVQHIVNGKVVYQSDNWDEEEVKRLEKEKREKEETEESR